MLDYLVYFSSLPQYMHTYLYIFHLHTHAHTQNNITFNVLVKFQAFFFFGTQTDGAALSGTLLVLWQREKGTWLSHIGS